MNRIQQLVKDVFDKVLPKLTDSAEKWIEDKNFLEILGKAGSIGALINVGIAICDKYKNDFKTQKDLAYASLIKIALQTAEETLKEKDCDFKESKKQEKGNAIPNNDEEKNRMKIKRDLLVGLFEIFKIEEKEFGWNAYFPNHPVIIEFKERMISLFKESKQFQNDIRQFIIEFNLSIEEKATNSEDIKAFNQWYSRKKHTKELTKYLIFAQSFMDKANPVDNKRLSEYYIRNKAFVVGINTWDKQYKRFPLKTEEWKIDKDLLENSDKWYTVIGAPFGIGKTSMAMDITSEYAAKYLDQPNHQNNYIPIFIRLRDKLKEVYQGRDLDYVLRNVVASETGELKKRNILLICDGLDEYSNNEKELSNLSDKITEYANDYPNLKVIITTRLKAGWARKLFPIKNYVRLFPFDKEQISRFFPKYGLVNINTEISYINENYGLTQEEIGKPLFCWMLAIMYSNSNSEQNGINSKDSKIILESITNSNAKRSLIYQEFIHSVIRGKHKKLENEYTYEPQEKEDFDSLTNEKKILRKIGALKHIHKERLTIGILNDGLKSYGINMDDREIQEEIIEPVITAYFHIGSTPSPISNDQLIEFIHESFKEYLIAEYYLENLLNERGKHYRLCIGIPSKNTILFLDGLLHVLFDDSNNFSLNQIRNRLLSSLTNKEDKEIDFDKIKHKLTDNLWEVIKDNRLFYIRKSKDNAFDDSNKIWNSINEPLINYADCWIHRHISFYVLQQLAKNDIKYKSLSPSQLIQEKKCLIPISNHKETITEIIRADSHCVPSYLKDYSILNLEKADLSGIDLVRSDFSYSNLSDAKIHHTDLSYATLKETTLIGADLTDANLTHAELEKSDLSEAVLINTNFFNAKLNQAKIFRAITSGIDITDTNFSIVHELENSETTISSFFFKEYSDFCLDKLNCSESLIKQTVRFIGLVNSGFEFLCGIQREGVERLLSKEDKQIMIHIASVGQGFRNSIDKMGNGIFFTEEYEKIIRVSIPLLYSVDNCINEPQAKSIFITLDKGSDTEAVLKILLKGYEGCHFSGYFSSLNDSEKFLPLDKYDRYFKDIRYISKSVEYGDFCQIIIDIDKNHHHIRDTYIFDRNYRIYGHASKPGLEDILPEPEQKELAMKITWARIKLREKFYEKIGKWEFALGVYEKLKRMTFPIRDQFDDIKLVLLITLEPNTNHEDIRHYVKKILDKTNFLFN